MRDGPIPSAFWWLFHWYCSNMSMSVLYWGAQNGAQSSRSGITSVESPPPASASALPNAAQEALRLPLLPRAHQSTQCPPRTPSLFLQSCFPAVWPAASTGPWGCSPLSAILGIFLWTPWSSCWLIFLDYKGGSEWQHSHLVYKALLLVLYHLQTLWGSTLSHHPGHYWRC